MNFIHKLSPTTFILQRIRAQQFIMSVSIFFCADLFSFILIIHSIISIVYGHGEQKVLLLGGMGSVSDSWGRLVVEFLKHPQFQVCVYDFRGIRYSTTTKPRFTFAAPPLPVSP